MWIKRSDELAQEVKESVLCSLKESSYILIITPGFHIFVEGRNRTKRLPCVSMDSSVVSNGVVVVANRKYAVLIDVDNVKSISINSLFSPSMLLDTLLDDLIFLYIRHNNNMLSLLEYLIANAYIQRI